MSAFGHSEGFVYNEELKKIVRGNKNCASTMVFFCTRKYELYEYKRCSYDERSPFAVSDYRCSGRGGAPASDSTSRVTKCTLSPDVCRYAMCDDLSSKSSPFPVRRCWRTVGFPSCRPIVRRFPRVERGQQSPNLPRGPPGENGRTIAAAIS